MAVQTEHSLRLGVEIKKKLKEFDLDVSFDAGKGCLGILGPSGCGKSTTLRMIAGLEKPTSGEIFIDDENVVDVDPGKRGIAMVFQNYALYPTMSVRDNIEFGLKNKKVPKEERNKLIADVSEVVGLTPYLSRKPSELSGGQRQRIGIARALAVNPEFIIADEPVSALDVSIQSQVLNLLRHLQESMGMAYIFISHNLSVIRHISDRVMVMYLGHVVELADKHQLYDNPSHPYTQALLSAIPMPERHSTRKKILLQGDLPSPADPPSGCVFHTRCFMAQEICSVQKPELKDIGGGHMCACHFCGGCQK